ncbi:SRPBCC family protein [Galbibacter mesophilus]|uniref:SRPBCC family protein n=1 Tax=Galbibacter mesophilus TaxID=379069 RepID=UPI00191D9561|nr:SRPBCC family protein [Galbibacter mesophilus]MCM5662825.1 SRPBCC family protein [Galbibacter mesophilus]
MSIQLFYYSGIYQLKTSQVVDAPLDEVWEYFSKPKNLNELTPSDMDFKITSSIVSETYIGQIISYSIKIFPWSRSYWITEITHVEDKKMFIDEQRFGPYAMWHHEHHFSQTDDGKTLMNDIVSYKLPMGGLGRLFAGKIIGNRIKKIFTFREKAVNSIFENNSVQNLY